MIMGRTRTNTSVEGAMYDLHISPARISLCWLGVYLLDGLSGVTSSSFPVVATLGSPEVERSGT
jgi:hypothetical protein